MKADRPETAESDNPRQKANPKGRVPSLGAGPFAGIAGLVVVLDQLTKWLVQANLSLHHSIAMIPGFFNLTHIHNPGGAFGFMATGSPGLRNLLFLGVATIAMGLIVYFYRSTPRNYPFLAVALAMIFGGAAGNIIDRLRFGVVVDFLDFYIGAYHWPAFNVADSAISVGIAIFIGHVILGKMPE
ncbi:signal peptidase II [uncultured Desulfosarcina sp.]|uniref:signal peptidase II n=1 Tax=uncultured Desulfosarcina sp. TaxID=218289 RepID=UPI0029C8D1AE|nr:signal peptidase II [uncultured Desulfosarcina sp.]